MCTLSSLSKEVLQDIAYSLDRLNGNKEEYWRLLMPLLPKESYRYNRVDVEEIAFLSIKGNSSPSLKLLQDFQRKGMKLDYFKNMLQKIDCQGALDCFKPPTIPIIYKEPVSVTVIVNNKVELECYAKCIPEPVDYQWFYYNRTSIPLKGAKSWKLIINKITMSNAGHYCCRVQNRRLRDDRYAVFSQYATVNVVDSKHAELETSGGSTHAVIPVQEVAEDRPPAVEPDGVGKISSPIDSTDTVGPLRIDKQPESQTVRLTKAEESVTLQCQAESFGPLRIVKQPESQTVRLTKAEQSVTLECQAESFGGQQLEYKWYYLRGSDNPATLKKKNKTVRSTEPYITITLKLTSKQEWRYYCEVSIANCPEQYVASNVAIVKLQSVWFVEQPKKKYVAVTGNELKLSCRVETAPGITANYQWFKCQQNGTGKQPTSFNDNEMLLPVVIASQGYYVCSVIAPHSDSIISEVAHVEVVNSTDIKATDQPPSDRYVELKGKLEIKFKALCKHFPVTYQWYYNGKELANYTSPTLTIESIDVHHIGSYHCEASSEYSTKTVTSETCRVHLKDANTSLSTINRQQFDAEEVVILHNTIYATDKMALLIGNGEYKGRPLKCSKNDVEAVTSKLQKLDFKTISLVDLTLSQMARAVDYFCSLLDQGMYAVFYYSGHGLEYQVTKTTYLMPIDADEPVKLDQCMNVDDVTAKMQMKKAKVFMIFDCCRINPSVEDTRSVQHLSSMPSSTNQSRGFSNLCQLFACTPSFESYEGKDSQHSYMTQGLLQELDKPKAVLQALLAIKDYEGDHALPGKVSPRPQLLLQMKAVDQISFHDPISNKQELKDKELLLDLPPMCLLEFTNSKLRSAYGQVELRFSAKFSNVMILHVVCNTTLQPELVDLNADLECSIRIEDNKAITSFKITNILDLTQDNTFKLQILFQMPADSSAKEIMEYKMPPNLIKPTFYHH